MNTYPGLKVVGGISALQRRIHWSNVLTPGWLLPSSFFIILKISHITARYCKMAAKYIKNRPQHAYTMYSLLFFAIFLSKMSLANFYSQIITTCFADFFFLLSANKEFPIYCTVSYVYFYIPDTALINLQTKSEKYNDYSIFQVCFGYEYDAPPPLSV